MRLETNRLGRERLTEEDVTAAAREQGFADLSDIAMSVLEDDGKFSFLPRSSWSQAGQVSRR